MYGDEQRKWERGSFTESLFAGFNYITAYRCYCQIERVFPQYRQQDSKNHLRKEKKMTSYERAKIIFLRNFFTTLNAHLLLSCRCSDLYRRSLKPCFPMETPRNPHRHNQNNVYDAHLRRGLLILESLRSITSYQVCMLRMVVRRRINRYYIQSLAAFTMLTMSQTGP